MPDSDNEIDSSSDEDDEGDSMAIYQHGSGVASSSGGLGRSREQNAAEGRGDAEGGAGLGEEGGGTAGGGGMSAGNSADQSTVLKSRNGDFCG